MNAMAMLANCPSKSILPAWRAHMARDPRRVLLLLSALLVGELSEAVVDQRGTGHLLQLFASVRPATVSPAVTTSLSVNCTSFRHGDSVSVTWANQSVAHGGSFVAWHVPADSFTYGAAPLKFQPASDGHLTFRLLNSRQPGRFVLYTGGLRSPVAVAVSQVITPEQPNEPTQIHLDSLGGAGALRVHWVTSNARLPTVRYGTSPGELTQASLASSRSYTAADLCGEPANGVGYLHPGTLHTAVLTDVTPGSLFYSVGDSAAPRDSLAWSPVYEARAPPPAGGGDVSALVSADVGTAEVDGSNVLSPEADDPAQRSWFSMLPSLDTAALMAAAVRREPGFPRTWANLSLWVHNGDISYALGYAGLWESFMDQFAVMHVLPYHTAIGNHESNWPSHGDAFNGEDSQDSGGECGVPYIARMPPPGLQPNGARLSDAAPWYSFEAGPIHFVQSSTEHSYLEGSPQRVWLEADLAAVNRSVTPWLVFSGHRPFVIDSYFPGDGDIGATLRSALEPLWAEYGVDLTLTGHHHSYQRTCALMTGTQRPTCARPCSDGSNPAPVHVVTGNGGAGLTATQRWRPAHFSAVHREHGFALLDANATHLWLRSLRSSDGKLLDSVMLVRPRSGAAVCAPVPVSFLRTIHPARVLAATAAICAAASALGGALYAVALGCSALRHRYLAAKASAEQAAALQEPLLGEQTDTATGSEPAVCVGVSH
jgi:hypothetical protein